MRDLIALQDEKVSKSDTVRRVIRELLEESAFIKSSEMVCKEVKSRTGLEVKERYILEQLHDLGLRYKKVKHISFQGNSQKSLVLR